MTTLLAILMVTAVFAYVAYPLFKKDAGASRARAVSERTSELSSKRDTAYSMIKELEFDYQSGILSREDYIDLEGRYKKKAVAILREIDGAKPQGAKPPGGKPAKENTVEDEIEKQVKQLRRVKGRFCTRCGARAEAADRFCASCGAPLGRQDAG